MEKRKKRSQKIFTEFTMQKISIGFFKMHLLLENNILYSQAFSPNNPLSQFKSSSIKKALVITVLFLYFHRNITSMKNAMHPVTSHCVIINNHINKNITSTDMDSKFKRLDKSHDFTRHLFYWSLFITWVEVMNRAPVMDQDSTVQGTVQT